MIKVAIVSALLALTPTAKNINKLNPVLDANYTNQLANLIDLYATQYGIEKEIVLSILFQESSFNPFPRDCNTSKEVCLVDIGIGQINYKVWKKHLNLNRKRLISDFAYNLETSFKILLDLKTRYGNIDKEWYCGYHSLTKRLKRNYCKKINRHLRRIRQ